MQSICYKDVPIAQQDAYFEYIAQTVMNQAFGNMNTQKMLAMANSIGDLIEQRHFYAYTTHADETKYFQESGISGKESTPQVGLYLNEQNPSKMGWYIKRKATMDGKHLTTNVAYIAPGKRVTFEFDVTTSPKATAKLTIDQTPSGKLRNEVDYQY